MDLPTVINGVEAAIMAGVDKATITKAIKEGRLSIMEKGPGGQLMIDPAEVQRVYPRADIYRILEARRLRDGGTAMTATEPVMEKIAELQARLDRMTEEKDRADVERDRLSQELDRERKAREAERDRLLTLVENAERRWPQLIEDLRIKPVAEPTKRRWWSWGRGVG